MKTTITIDKEVRDKLKEIKLTKHEMYDEIIERLIKFYKGVKEEGQLGQNEKILEMQEL